MVENKELTISPTEQNNLEGLTKIIGLCDARCKEILNPNVSIDYQLLQIIKGTAESVLCNLQTDIREKNPTGHYSPNTPNPTEIVKDCTYKLWKDYCRDEYHQLKFVIRDCGGAKYVNTKALNDNQNKFKELVEKELEKEYEEFKHSEEGETLILELGTSMFNSNDFSTEALGWINWIDRKDKEHYDEFGL